MNATVSHLPGSVEWYATISASKIAAILGVSPWESRYSLWHRMKGIIPAGGGNAATNRGHYLEPALLAWCADQHPEWQLRPGRGFTAEDNPLHTATPDGVFTEPGLRKPIALVEAKSTVKSWEWGAEGTHEIPPYYRAQVAWQIHITGIDTVFVPVITEGLRFLEYVVTLADVEDDITFILDAVREWEALLAGDEPPATAGDTATYEAIRDAHPQIDGADYVTDEDTATGFVDAVQAFALREKTAADRKNALFAAMGTARRAIAPDGTHIATRTARNGGRPYLQPARHLTK